MTSRNGKPATGRSPADLEATLNGCWVVLIMDPDCEDSSPWSVVADDAGEAVDKALEQWKDWLTDPDDPIPRTLPKPHIVKAYRNSWITDIARGERYSGFLGIHAMRKLSNRGSD
jgi:hypothetical protein